MDTNPVPNDGRSNGGRGGRRGPDRWTLFAASVAHAERLAAEADTNEEMAFRAKDACIVVDDFKPSGDASGDAKLHQAADRLLRAQGNHCGRGRMNADGSLRAVRPPRGMIISTGEELPRRHSLRARTFINEITPGSIDLTKLTQCQKDAARGLYAAFLSAFIASIAPRVEQLQANFKARVDAVRGEFTGDHARTSPMLAELFIAFDMLIEFIVEATGEQVLTADEGAREIGVCSDALKASGSVQSMLQGQADPVDRYFELISSALASGRAHIAGSDGNAPRDPPKWGWRLEQEGAREVYRPMGDRIGWVEDGDLYLEPLAAHRIASTIAGNDPLSVGERTLAKRLHERGSLLSVEKGRGTHRVRKVLDGERRAVLHLPAGAISGSAEDSGDQTGVDEAVDRFVQATQTGCANGRDLAPLRRELAAIDASVSGLLDKLDPANLPLVNDRLTQLRRRKEAIQTELRAADSERSLDEAGLRKWATERLGLLAETVGGRRDEKARRLLGCYVDELVIDSGARTGYLVVNATARSANPPTTQKTNNPPGGGSSFDAIAGA